MPVAEIVLASIGSNLGDRETNIRRAIEELKTLSIDGSIKASRAYETEPVGYVEQPLFLNCAVLFESIIDAVDLIVRFKEIELKIGRIGRERWREREIDIDLILYGSMEIDHPDCRAPHPRMAERMFVLAPAAEIAGAALVPGRGKTVAELLAELSENYIGPKATPVNVNLLSV